MDDLTDKRVGKWTVIGPSKNKKYYWVCRCECGVVKDVYGSSLRLEKSTSCGHDGNERRKLEYAERRKDIIGKHFGRLIVKEWIMDKHGKLALLCECKCGKTTIATRGNLENGNTNSCGCIRSERSAKSIKNADKKWDEVKGDYFVEGTALHNLDEKISKNSKTGVKGVSKMKNGSYRAYINIKRKQIYLGTFDTIDDAKEAREEAEKEYFEPIRKKYEK